MPSNRPNIIFFFTDDQRFDTIAALGHPEIKTPTLDKLVSEGTSFTHATIMGGTVPAVCMPSRAMLMTGRSLYRLSNHGEDIPDEHALIGETLRNSGYRTFGTGKWHNGNRSYARSFSDGAEIMFGGMGDHWNVPVHSFDPTGQYEKRFFRCKNNSLSNQLETHIGDHITAGKHSSELFCDAAINWIESYDDDSPFFAYISFMAPHDPRTMPQEFLNLYSPDSIALPPNYTGGHPFDTGAIRIRDEQLEGWPRSPAAIRRHIAEYYAMITHADAQIGRVLHTLELKGLRENTIIIFAGDNGLAVGQHGLMGKQSMYDHSLRVPLILSGPGIPAGQKRDSFCYLFDLFPTICDLIHLDVPTTVEGRSLVPVLTSPKNQIRESLHFAYMHYQRAVRNHRWKLAEYCVNGEHTTQLFDIQQDPWETHNLASNTEHAATIEVLRKELSLWKTEYGDTSDQGNIFWGQYDKAVNRC